MPVLQQEDMQQLHQELQEGQQDAEDSDLQGLLVCHEEEKGLQVNVEGSGLIIPSSRIF
jgi:hypothetical protein